MPAETFRDGPQLFNPIGVNATPGVGELPDQPRPHRSLVIGEISRAQIAKILWLIVRMTRLKRSQPEWSEQLIVHYVNNGLPTLWVKNRMRQRECEQLIRPDGVVVAVLGG